MSKGTAHAEMLPDLEIQPTDALVDATVSIRLRGLIAEQQVTLRAEMADYLGCAWASRATFVADRHGFVDVANQRPVAGTYDRPDPMGLFWSMMPVEGTEPRGYASASVAPMQVQFTAEVNGSNVASATCRVQKCAKRAWWQHCFVHPVLDPIRWSSLLEVPAVVSGKHLLPC